MAHHAFITDASAHHDPAGAIVPAEPLFTVASATALAGFLAGYSGLTRDAYALDLPQYVQGASSMGCARSRRGGPTPSVPDRRSRTGPPADSSSADSSLTDLLDALKAVIGRALPRSTARTWWASAGNPRALFGGR